MFSENFSILFAEIHTEDFQHIHYKHSYYKNKLDRLWIEHSNFLEISSVNIQFQTKSQ